MKYGVVVPLVLAPFFVVKAIVYPPGDGDLFWQRWLGSVVLQSHALPRSLGNEAFTAAGAPWVPQEWLFSTLLSFSAAHGAAWAFDAAIALCPIVALWLVAVRAARHGATPLTALVCAAFAGVALLESFGVRVQVAAWLLIALFLLALDEDGAWLWATVPIAALWSNLHASAMLAPVLVAAAAVGVVLEDRAWTPRLRRHVLVAGACALALCLNPLGPELPRYAIGLFSSPIKHWIAEWKTTDAADISFLLGAFPLLAIAMVAGFGAPRQWKQGLVLAAFAVLLFTAARNIAVFGIAAAPIVAARLSRYLPRREPRPLTALDRGAQFAFPAFALAVGVACAVTLAREAPPPLADLPVQAIAAIDAMPGTHRLLCGDFAWCALEFPPDGGIPRAQVFLDGRADPFPVSVWRDFVAISLLQPDWRQRLDARGVNVVLVKVDAPLAQALALAPDWRRAYRDAKFLVYLRRGDGRRADAREVRGAGRIAG